MEDRARGRNPQAFDIQNDQDNISTLNVCKPQPRLLQSTAKEKVDIEKKTVHESAAHLVDKNSTTPGETFSQVTDSSEIATIKVLLDFVVLEHHIHKRNIRFVMLGLTNFYLGSLLDRPKSVKVSTKDIL